MLNLDGDVGPWLQVIKLKGIKDTAEQAGRGNLSPAELELMNLAGPRTGLEMMEPAGRMAPSANFFSQGAYYRNTIVREKTAAELLAAIDHRMNENMLRPGSIEFAAVFDEVATRGRTAMPGLPQQLLPASAVRPVVDQARVAPAGPVAGTPVAAAPIPPAPMRALPPGQALAVPAPMRAERPQPPQPSPRLHWAPPGLTTRGGAVLGFPE